jgi:hypothetical protein
MFLLLWLLLLCTTIYILDAILVVAWDLPCSVAEKMVEQQITSKNSNTILGNLQNPQTNDSIN